MCESLITKYDAMNNMCKGTYSEAAAHLIQGRISYSFQSCSKTRQWLLGLPVVLINLAITSVAFVAKIIECLAMSIINLVGCCFSKNYTFKNYYTYLLTLAASPLVYIMEQVINLLKPFGPRPSLEYDFTSFSEMMFKLTYPQLKYEKVENRVNMLFDVLFTENGICTKPEDFQKNYEQGSDYSFDSKDEIVLGCFAHKILPYWHFVLPAKDNKDTILESFKGRFHLYDKYEIEDMKGLPIESKLS